MEGGSNASDKAHSVFGKVQRQVLAKEHGHEPARFARVYKSQGLAPDRQGRLLEVGQETEARDLAKDCGRQARGARQLGSQEEGPGHPGPGDSL